jgi:hypothetical protein
MLSNKLPVRPLPKKDESIIGYLLRITEANGYESMNWLLEEFKLHRTNVRQNYVYGTTDLHIMAKTIEVDESLLNQMTFKPLEASSSLVGNYKVFGKTIRSFIIRPNAPKICPACLGEDGYCRRVWEIAVLTVCPKHCCRLLQECPGCGKAIKWNRKRVCQCDCGYDWRELKAEKLPDGELRLVYHFYELMGLAKAKDAAEMNLPDVLRNLDFMDLLNVLFTVTAQMRGRGDISGKTLCKLPNAELHQELVRATGLFEDFPFNFFRFLDSLKKVYSPKIRKDNPKANRFSTQRMTIFGGIIRTVFKGLSGSQFDFLRNAFDEYCAHEKLSNLGVELNRNDLKAVEFLTEHASLLEAKKTLESTNEVIREIINAGGLRAFSGRVPDGNTFWFINRKDLLIVKERLKDCVTAMKIRGILSVHHHHVDYLIRDGFLTEIPDLRIAPVFARVFSRRQAEGIYRMFEEAANSVKEQPLTAGKPRLSSSHTAFLLGRLGIDFGEMTRLVRDRVISPVGSSAGGKGLLSFEYDKAEIEAFCERRIGKLKAATLSVSETSRELNIKGQLVFSIIKKEILKEVERDRTFYLKTRIRREALDDFKKNYVLANIIARENHTTSRIITEKLSELGIEPVDNSSKTYCYVYRRTDVTGVTFVKNNRPEPELFSVAETARILNLETEDVLALSRNGVLKTYHLMEESKRYEEPYFTKTIMESFKKLELKSLNVVSRKSAARILGVGESAFYARYLKSGTLLPVKLEGESSCQLFSLDEIENLRHLEVEGIRAGEVAQILGVNTSCVNKMTLSGHLKPVSGPKIDGFQYNVYLRSEVKVLRGERTVFKKEQLKAGKSNRFGRPSGNRYSKRKVSDDSKTTCE